MRLPSRAPHPSPRRLAAEHLGRVLARRSCTPEGLADEPAYQSLDDADRRLCFELLLGTLRHLALVDAVLERLCRRPPRFQPPLVRNLLRTALYQLFFLERVPDYAAVDEAVGEIRRSPYRGMGGFANGVLRAAARQGRPEAVLDVDPATPTGLALLTSHPPFLVERWLERHPREAIEAWLRRANRPPAHYLVTNTRRTDAAALAAAWAVRGVAVRPTRPDWPVLAVDGSLRDIDGELDAGLCYPQDLWSFAISRLVPERPYRAVADLCAAPGGKSFALSLRFPDAHVAAMDSHPARLAVLARRAAALGLDRIAVVVGDAAAPPLPAAGFDLVLVDAPCSGTGTLQRNPDLRWKLKEEDILRLSRLQRPILAAAAGLVAPGGILVYATCSAEPEENEAVVDEFLEHAAGAFRPLPPDAAETQFITRDGYFRTFPIATEGEGFFAAVMERQDTDCGPLTRRHG
ncbi:MAG TPA: transcription antitermination factor NusB [Acidobacteriota bacterium]|nr:transcription antitermination factor NusB [Acidobacteriota bacterium]HQM62645.1 transcription antitermination factor NusB [Acidobacteriota bacterium]